VPGKLIWSGCMCFTETDLQMRVTYLHIFSRVCNCYDAAADPMSYFFWLGAGIIIASAQHFKHCLTSLAGYFLLIDPTFFDQKTGGCFLFADLLVVCIAFRVHYFAFVSSTLLGILIPPEATF